MWNISVSSLILSKVQTVEKPYTRKQMIYSKTILVNLAETYSALEFLTQRKQLTIVQTAAKKIGPGEKMHWQRCPTWILLVHRKTLKQIVYLFWKENNPTVRTKNSTGFSKLHSACPQECFGREKLRKKNLEIYYFFRTLSKHFSAGFSRTGGQKNILEKNVHLYFLSAFGTEFLDNQLNFLSNCQNCILRVWKTSLPCK